MKGVAARILFAVLAATVAGNALAENGAGSTAAAFLKIPTSARALGMGETFVAVADDGFSLNWNPAGLGNVSRPELDFTHASYLLETMYGYAAYVRPLGKLGSVAVGGILLDSDGIPKTTEDSSGSLAVTGGDFYVRDTAVLLGWGKSFNGTFAMGATFKLINQKIDDDSSRGYAGDYGLMYAPARFVQLGASVQNTGPDIDGDNLPTVLRLGCTGRFGKSWIVPVEVDKARNEDPELGIGTEVWIADLFALRAGYRTGVDVEGAKGLRAGGSIRIKSLRLDYGYADYGEFEAMHQFSVVMNLGRE